MTGFVSSIIAFSAFLALGLGAIHLSSCEQLPPEQEVKVTSKEEKKEWNATAQQWMTFYIIYSMINGQQTAMRVTSDQYKSAQVGNTYYTRPYKNSYSSFNKSPGMKPSYSPAKSTPSSSYRPTSTYRPSTSSFRR